MAVMVLLYSSDYVTFSLPRKACCKFVIFVWYSEIECLFLTTQIYPV
jgi:hypothetical protein